MLMAESAIDEPYIVIDNVENTFILIGLTEEKATPSYEKLAVLDPI